jgi:hypothetical protein
VRLKGTVRIIVPSSSESFQISNLRTAGTVTKSVGGRRFMVGELKKSGDGYVLPLTFYRGVLGREEWRQLLQSGGIRQAVRILDADGNPLAIRTSGNANADLNKTESTLNLSITRERIGKAQPEPAEPMKFIYEVTTEVRDMVVPFELRDIALP